MIERIIAEKVKYLTTEYPMVTLTGTRQCGKSILLKSVFPDYRYVSLEDFIRYEKEKTIQRDFGPFAIMVTL